MKPLRSSQALSAFLMVTCGKLGRKAAVLELVALVHWGNRQAGRLTGEEPEEKG